MTAILLICQEDRCKGCNASVLVMKPQVMILDEPTSQLDPEGTEEVFRVVDRLSRLELPLLW